MKRHLLVGLVAAALALTANVGFALPISIIDQGDTVWDQNTNQDWLALDTVAPCSQADLDDATFGCEFLADGWTLASLTEVDAFLENVGLTPGFSLEPGLINLALELINILGPTIVSVWRITSIPLLAEPR